MNVHIWLFLLKLCNNIVSTMLVIQGQIRRQDDYKWCVGVRQGHVMFQQRAQQSHGENDKSTRNLQQDS